MEFIPTQRLNGCYLVPPPDHVWRYEEAARVLGDTKPYTADIGCGTGYGLSILGESGIRCAGFDLDPEAVRAATNRGVSAFCEKASFSVGRFGACILFDVIEHDEMGMGLLDWAAAKCGRVLFSVVRDEQPPGSEHAQKYHKLWGLTEESFSWMSPKPEWIVNPKWPYILYGSWRHAEA